MGKPCVTIFVGVESLSDEMVGFGVRVYSEWYDSGTVPFKPDRVKRDAEEVLADVQRVFRKEWLLRAEPQILISLGYA